LATGPTAVSRSDPQPPGLRTASGDAWGTAIGRRCGKAAGTDPSQRLAGPRKPTV